LLSSLGGEPFSCSNFAGLKDADIMRFTRYAQGPIGELEPELGALQSAIFRTGLRGVGQSTRLR
jgi:hypothetical protein